MAFRPLTDIRNTMREIYEYRVVLSALIRRNTAGRYKSSYVGFMWHLLLPILTVAVLDFAFTSIRPRAIENYWIYLSAGVFPLGFITSTIRGNAIVRNTNYITKMYIPREIVIIADTATNFLGVLFAFLFITILILASGQYVDWTGILICFPLEMIIMFIFGAGCTFLFSTITVFVKDIGHLMSVLIRLVFYVSPTFFFIDETSGLLAEIIWWNPITYFLETFHEILYWGVTPDLFLIGTSAAIAFGTLIVGYTLFRLSKDRLPEVL